MKTIKELSKSKNFKIGAVLIGIFIIIIIFVVLLILNLDSDKTRISRLNKIASTFYTEFYYNQVSTTEAGRMQVIQKNVDKGIVLTAMDLSKFSDDDIFKEMSKECDLNKTKVTIYPKSPYSKLSFDTKVELNCDLKEQIKQAKNEPKK